MSDDHERQSQTQAPRHNTCAIAGVCPVRQALSPTLRSAAQAPSTGSPAGFLFMPKATWTLGRKRRLSAPRRSTQDKRGCINTDRRTGEIRGGGRKILINSQPTDQSISIRPMRSAGVRRSEWRSTTMEVHPKRRAHANRFARIPTIARSINLAVALAYARSGCPRVPMRAGQTSIDRPRLSCRDHRRNPDHRLVDALA